LTINAHTAAATTDLVITCYDSTGASELSAGTNSSQEDYGITLGANGEDTFYCKIKLNAADKAYHLAAIAVSAFNDIRDVRLEAFDKATGITLTESQKTFSSGYLPLYLSNAKITCDTSGACGSSNTNVTGYDRVYVLDEPILLHEWDEVQYQFTIYASSTDPTTTTEFGNSDMGIICFLDAVWDRDYQDGKEYFTYYTRDTDENDVGVSNTVSYPVGKDDCVVIEGI
jgi:hypothetical protein